MIVEYSFISQANNKCYLALCSEPEESIQEVTNEYWRKHGIEDGSWGRFAFHRNADNEYIGLVACTEITPQALEYGLASFEQYLGQRCQVTDLLNIVRDFAKKELMKDAIDSEVKWCNHGYPDTHMEDLAVLDEVQLPKDKFAIGDKVKVIIIKR